MTKSIKKIIIFGIFLLLIIIGYQMKYFLSLHKPYSVSCEQFMDVGNIKNWKNDNLQLLNNLIEKSIFVDFDLTTCEGKFGLIINYGSNDIKNEIIQIIGDTVFINSVPYKMNNL